MTKETLIDQLNEELRLFRQKVSPQGLVNYEITDRIGTKLKVHLVSQETLTNPWYFCQDIARKLALISGVEEFQIMEATCEMPFGTCTFEVPLRHAAKQEIAWPKYGVAS